MKIWRKKTEAKKPREALVESGFADAFEAVLSEQEIHYTTEVNDRGDAIFRIPYRTEASRRVTVLLQFDRAENVIRFYAFGYIQNTPPEREAAILEKLNDVNRRFLFYKFYLDDDRDIVLCWYFPYLTKDQLFSPGGLNLYILRALDVLDKLHGEFMEAVDGETEAKGPRTESTKDASAASARAGIMEAAGAVEDAQGPTGTAESSASAADSAAVLESSASSDSAAALEIVAGPETPDAPGAADDCGASDAKDESSANGEAASSAVSAPDGRSHAAYAEGMPEEDRACEGEERPEGAGFPPEPEESGEGEEDRKAPPRLYVVKPREPDA